MYVCLCKGITDNQIKDAINQGACSMRDLRADLDVATQCGKCARDCKSILLESMTSNQANALPNAQFVAA